jgi:hypothetical protein
MVMLQPGYLRAPAVVACALVCGEPDRSLE